MSEEVVMALQAFEGQDANLIRQIVDTVADITDRSDAYVSRIRVIFKNGYELSVIRGSGMFRTYGGDAGLFEVAVIKDEEWATKEVLGVKNDDVLGWQSKEDVIRHMVTVGNLA